MSMQVDRFLSDSGANFTESAPRPPVPGEENELHSNGGTSTKSSSSHKSQLSAKSHVSNKSGRSDISHHSPAATPRRSNLDKSLATTFQHDVSKLADHEAPLGFEPEGSAASSPPFNENGTPPYLKWAENIEVLLDDREGVRLFKQFLDQEHSSKSLDFWFACKGLKVGVQADDAEKIQCLVKLIYKHYIRGDHLGLPADMKKSITGKFKKEKYDQGMFQDAQLLIQNRMSNDTYPLFLKSDIYVQYVQMGGESPKTISNTSSGSNSARPMSSGPLPTVPEGEELKQEDLKAVSAASNTTILPLTSAGLSATYSIRANNTASKPFAIPEGFPRFSQNKQGGSAASGSSSSSFLRPGHPEHLSYAPVSQVESEVQSLSSDALTESDTMSHTDSSVDGRDARRGSRPWKKKQRQIKHNAIQNRHTGLTVPLIPRTDRALKDRNIAETEPAKFAAMLIEKLEQVKAKREEPERMKEYFNTLENVDVPSSSAHKTMNMSSMNASAVGPVGAGAVNNSAVMNASSSSMNNSLSLLMASIAQEEDNAQSILEDHMSRVWDESQGQTPSLTPGRHSPDRLRGPPAPGAPATPQAASSSLLHHTSLPLSRPHHKRNFISASASSSSKEHMLSVQSFDSGVASEDKQQQAAAAAAAGVFIDPDSHHKHIHHYHHHHHHILKDKMRGGSGGHMIPAPALTHQVPTPKDSSTNKRSAKYIPDNNSNIDSGIHVYDNTTVPNLRDPASEKVMAWMLENDKVSTGNTQYSTDNSDKGSSHKRSHKSGSSSLHKSSSKKQQAYESSRSASLDRSSHHHPGAAAVQRGADLPFLGGAGGVQPSQPIVQDPSMPLLTPAKTTVQLEEVRRRLSDEQARMGKSKSFSTGMSSSSSSSMKDKQRGGGMPPPLPPRSLQQRSNIPASQVPQQQPLDLSGSEDHNSHSFSRSRSSSSRRPTAPPHSVPATPTSSAVPAALSSSVCASSSAAAAATPDVTVVGYYFCSEPIPYRSTLHGSRITLAMFKDLLTKKGNYRYFFKKASDEFDSGVVYEEVSYDHDVLPLCDGKIIGKVDKVE